MLKDITLGQFFPGDTVAHRLDPRTKILLVVLYIVALFCAKSLLAYGILAAVLAVCVRISRVGIKSLVRGLKPVVFIIVFTGILNLFFTPGEHILAELGFLRISAEGLQNAVFMVLRIMLLIMGTFLMTYTTSPISLTDGLERLLGGLKKIHVPVHELAMIMSIALRFIPTLIEETDKIMSAQKARGADFESGNIIQKAKALIPILVPLFISAFRRADELAVAMECRCYHGGEGRTKLHVLQYEGGTIWPWCWGWPSPRGSSSCGNLRNDLPVRGLAAQGEAQPQADGKGSRAPAEIAAGEEITDLDLHVLRHGHPVQRRLDFRLIIGHLLLHQMVAVGIEQKLKNGWHRRHSFANTAFYGIISE